MKTTAVIPVRQGSQRVINKSLRPFGNSSLLELKINALKNVSGINEIIVNTDSEEAITIAKKMNVQFHRREAYYASSECSNSEFLEHLGKVTDTDVFAYCPCTSPFIAIETMENCIKMFFRETAYDSVATVTPVKEFLWLEGVPLNYSRDKQPNSQNLPDIFALNFGLNLIRADDLIKYKNIVGINPIFEVVGKEEGLDIDTMFDFEVAEYLFKKKQNTK